jgi:hypothetical protein
MLNYLQFKTLYFRQQNPDANIFKNNIFCCSIVDTINIRVLTK